MPKYETTRDTQALWVRCPECGRDIDVPPSRVLSFLEYKLVGYRVTGKTARRAERVPAEEEG